MAINMNYARFENTFKALKECDPELFGPQGSDGLSVSERRYFDKLVELCREIAEENPAEAEFMPLAKEAR